MVPNVIIVDNSTMVNETIVTLTLSWGEPFNYLDPIVNYVISCSNVRCPPYFTIETTDNATRNYTITDLSPNTYYTFSVAAVNSFGKGRTGVVMVTTPGEITLLSTYVVSYVALVDLAITICMYVAMYVCMYVCMYVRTYVPVYIAMYNSAHICT